MSAQLRFALAVAVLGLLMTGPFVLTGVLLFADAAEAERAALIDLLAPRLPLGAFVTALGFLLGVAVIRMLFKQYVQGLQGMSEKMRLMLGTNRHFRIAPEGPPEVRELARAVNDLGQQRDELLSNVELQIDKAKASLEEEKNRLAALMAELAMGVVVCNLDGRILLYNSRARLQFKALVQGPTSLSGGAAIGLGRSIFSILGRGQITHALDDIKLRLQRGASQPSAQFITSTRSGQLLRTQMAPVLALPVGDSVERVMTGYVLTLENITRSFERELQRDQLMQQLTDDTRSALGVMRTAVETLLGSPDMTAELREHFARVIADEIADMSRQLEGSTREFADLLKTRWPLEDVLGVDIIAVATRRLESQLGLAVGHEEIDSGVWIRADSFSLVQTISFLAARLQESDGQQEVRFRLSSEGRVALLDLIWSGASMSAETLLAWERAPMSFDVGHSPLTLRDVMDRHGGEIRFQRESKSHRACFRWVLPAAVMPDAPTNEPTHDVLRGSRPEYYDFDLFAVRDQDTAGEDLDRRLADLTFSVFDTETTGLSPSEGDEIIQIGAVRIVNGRLLRQEVFDQLVDPGKPLKPEGIRIHGITEDMVRGQPRIDVVLPAFHEFCADTVLVAHNAAFDMRFFQMQENSLNVRFTQPVLDTLLLSTVVHPNQESHKLEVIAERMGVRVIGRHTALGDAFVTGEVFLKMIPLLADKGIVTLRQALDAAQKTYFARIRY